MYTLYKYTISYNYVRSVVVYVHNAIVYVHRVVYTNTKLCMYIVSGAIDYVHSVVVYVLSVVKCLYMEYKIDALNTLF